MSDDLLEQVRALHAQVEAQAHALAVEHAGRLQCRRGCAGCCHDGLSVGPAEAHRIRSECGAVLAEAPHPVGACAFLDAEGACRIYAARPQICRTQGLPLLTYAYDPVEDDVVESRDICPLNAEGPPLETLAEKQLWHDGAAGLALANLAAEHGRDPENRVPLRNLFQASRC